MAPASDDPRVIQSIAVTADDVVTALEHNRSGSRRAVIRITPPFNGRMRARLHVTTDEEDTGAIHVDPANLIDEERALSYPEPAETEDALRADPDVEYTSDRHRERHVEAVEEWRQRMRNALAESVTIETPTGPYDIAVKSLG